jgi:hypothetical protein
MNWRSLLHVHFRSHNKSNANFHGRPQSDPRLALSFLDSHHGTGPCRRRLCAANGVRWPRQMGRDVCSRWIVLLALLGICYGLIPAALQLESFQASFITSSIAKRIRVVRILRSASYLDWQFANFIHMEIGRLGRDCLCLRGHTTRKLRPEARQLTYSISELGAAPCLP